MKPVEDMTGRRFGRIVVLEDAGPGYNRNHNWKVRCDCGTVFEVAGSNLRLGKTRSCGCLRQEIARSHCPAMHAATSVPVVVTSPDGVRHLFASMSEAARWLGCTPYTISRNIHRSAPFRGNVIELMNKA